MVLGVLVGGFALADQLTGIDSRYWAGLVVLSGSTVCIPSGPDAGAPCALFPASAEARSPQRSSFVTLTAGGAAGCCATLHSTTIDLNLNGSLKDDAGTKRGAGACIQFRPTGGTRYIKENYYELRNAAGAAPGICAITVVNANETIYPPCKASSDCALFGLDAGTPCLIDAGLITSDMLDKIGHLEMCEGTTVNVDSEKNRIRTVIP